MPVFLRINYTTTRRTVQPFLEIFTKGYSTGVQNFENLRKNYTKAGETFRGKLDLRRV